MLSRLGVIITAVGSAAVLAVAVGEAPSSATTATTWTVKPGGSATASGPVSLKDTKTGTPTPCKSVKLDATLKRGGGLAGASIGSIRSGTFTGCSVGGALDLSVAVNGLPWKLGATSYNAKTGVTTGTITGIDIVRMGTGCHATLDGTGAGRDNGKVNITYTNSIGKLKLVPKGGNLHWWISGCIGLIDNGNPVHPSGSLTVKPKQTVTSP